MALLPKSTAYTRVFYMYDSTDHVTPKTGLTVTANLCKSGETTFSVAGGTVTEIANGAYKLSLTTTDTNTSGDLAYNCTASGADNFQYVDQVDVTVKADVAEIDGLAAAASTLKLWLASDVSGTADSGTTTTMVDSARTEADTNYWKGSVIAFTSGNIAGQHRKITGFDPATDTITFYPALTQAVTTQTYTILPGAGSDVISLDGLTATLAILVQWLTEEIGGAVDSCTATTLTDSILTQTTTDHFKGGLVVYDTGINAGVPGRRITGFNPATDTITHRAFPNTSSPGDFYHIENGDLVDLGYIAGNLPAATNISRSTQAIVLGTVGTGSTTTSIVTSSLDPAAITADQFKNRVVTFDRSTTTAALRGQSTDIAANTSGGVLTVSSLTTAAVSGDTFTIT